MKNWIEKPLGEIFEVVTGNTPSKKEPDNYGNFIPFIKPPNVENSIINESSGFLSEKGRSVGRILPAESVLITCIGNLGRVGINKEEVAFNQQINALKPIAQIKPKFLFYQAQTSWFRSKLEEKSTSTTVALVNKSNFSTLPFRIAPLPTQRAIVAKIEELFSSLDTGIADLKKAQEQLKIYRQAVLKKAFEGKWQKEELKNFADITGGVTKGRKLNGKETVKLPYLRVANVQDGFLNLDVIKTIEVLPNDLEKYKLEFEDVLFTEGGDRDKLGRGTVWKNEIESCIHQNHIFRARVKDKSTLNPYFLTYFAQSPQGKDYFFRNGKHTTNLASINKTILSNLPIPLPPISEQKLIIKKIETDLSVADKVSDNIQENMENAKYLRQSILKKAFEGKLLTEEEVKKCKQEQDYEPADALLQKIKAEKKKK